MDTTGTSNMNMEANNRRDSCTSTTTSDCSDPNSNEGSSSQQQFQGQGQGSQKRTQAEKKMDRILANRRSARRSRERRKKLQQNLEVSVAFLGKQNEELTQENTMLKQELQILINLVNQLSKQGQGPLPTDLGLESLLQQIQPIVNANTVVNADTVPQINVNVAPTDNTATNPTTALLSGGSEGLNSMTPQRVLALSQLITSQNQSQQPNYFQS